MRGDEVAPHAGASALWACGILGKVHGLRGELYLNLAPGGLDRLSRGSEFYLGDRDPHAPEGAERVVPCAATREAAIALQGRELFAAGGDLDAEPHYRVGVLLGLPVETVSGRPLGEVSDVLEAPAHEVLEVRAPDGASVLVPLVDELVTLDAESGVLRVVDGLLDEPEG